MKSVIAILIFALLSNVTFAADKADKHAPAPMMRVKVTALEPEQPVRIIYSWGGQGLGGTNHRVELQLLEPKKAGLLPGAHDAQPIDDLAGVPDEFKSDPAAMDTVTDAKNIVYLKPGVWSRPTPLATMPHGFIQFAFEGQKTGNEITNLRVQFEFTVGGKVVDQFEESGDIGPIVTIVLNGADPAAPDWAERTMGLHQYVDRRAKTLESFEWSKLPVPHLITFLSDCGGFGTGGYAVRHSSKEVLRNEARCLTQLGVNSLRSGYATMLPYMRELPGVGEFFGRRIEVHAGYQPVIPIVIDHTTGRIVSVPPGGGCPWYTGIEERAKAEADECVKTFAAFDNREVWALTSDEIGSIFDGAPEGKAHMSVCPYCLDAFRNWLKNMGHQPADFDCKTWDEVRNIAYPNARLWADVQAEKKQESQAFQNTLPGVAPGTAKPISLENKPDMPTLADPAPPKPAAPTPAPAAAKRGAPAAAAKADDTAVDHGDEEKNTEPDAATTAPAPQTETPGHRLLAFYSWEFNNYSTAHTYSPLREACEAHNRAKQAALDKGDLSSPLAKQAFVYSFALRGNTFLMGDHSLDFFEFYRQADNAMVYETSNRDARVWHWDSYLCDVGRSLELHMGKKFGIYVKPHRGAPIQRALAAIARGAEFVFWYTYGPDYAKGDSFSSSDYHMQNTSKAARIIGANEDVLVGAKWTNPPQVAVVRNSTPSNAEWEEGKWVYTALQHSHVPVDALDQKMLATEDLSHYKIIYVTGGMIRRASALALRRFVESGGTIYAGAGSMITDESGLPVKELLEVFGVSARQPAQVWCEGIRRYGATGLSTFGAFNKPPEGADSVTLGGASFACQVGREVLQPLGSAVVQAKFADGSPALIVNAFGKGHAYLSALYGGLEYATNIQRGDFNMETDYDAVKRNFVAAPALQLVPPPVLVSVPTVEAIALTEPKSGRRSVVLLNWTYDPHKQLVPHKDVKITIAKADGVSGAKSAWLNKELPVQREGDALIVTYPALEEGDVITLH